MDVVNGGYRALEKVQPSPSFVSRNHNRIEVVDTAVKVFPDGRVTNFSYKPNQVKQYQNYFQTDYSSGPRTLVSQK